MTQIFHGAPHILFSLLIFCACGRGDQATDTGVTQNKAAVEKAATKVKQKAQATGKAEGSQDLVKDKVAVQETANGTPVIEQTGEASSYGQEFHGKATANGEKFNKDALTAAHPTLPLGTKAKVTNLDNGKSVDVRINDRGPDTKGRDIDVSQAAAKKLDLTKKGIAPVKIEAKIAPSDNSISRKSAQEK